MCTANPVFGHGERCIVDDKLGSAAIAPLAVPVDEGHSRQPIAAGRKAMPRKKVSTTIYIEPEQLELLKLLNERTKVPMAEYIREGIDLVLHKHHDKLPGQLPLVEGSPAPRRG